MVYSMFVTYICDFYYLSLIFFFPGFIVVFFFFFSSRRRHTRLVSDWSSDVCSSDLGRARAAIRAPHDARRDRQVQTVLRRGPDPGQARLGRVSARPGNARRRCFAGGTDQQEAEIPA